jgi:hypothetical protein
VTGRPGAARAGAPACSAPRVLGAAFEHVDLGAQADVALDKQCLGAGANAAAGPTLSGGD